ncbi:MAG: hypothetical protein ABSF78_00685 [Candidatus Acidiferrales bacterium]
MLDSTGTTVLDTESISSFANGVYLRWNISGHVQIRAGAKALAAEFRVRTMKQYRS